MSVAPHYRARAMAAIHDQGPKIKRGRFTYTKWAFIIRLSDEPGTYVARRARLIGNNADFDSMPPPVISMVQFNSVQGSELN